MSKPIVPSFSPAEKQRRWDLARNFMKSEGLDALIVFGEHEDAGPGAYSYDTYFTNDRPGATVVFPRDGDPYSLVTFVNCLTDHKESAQRGDAVWIPPQKLRLGRDPGALIGLLDELQLANSTIGVLGIEPAIPMHFSGIIPHGLWQPVLERFPDATFKSVAAAFIQAIFPLSDEEVAVVRHAASIGEEMAQAMVAAARPGARESDVYLAGARAALAHGTLPSWTHLNSGPDVVVWGPPRWAWRPQPPRTLQAGDLVVAEIFTSCGMRSTQHQLTAAIGDVHADIERAAAVARASYEAGLRALRPGALFGEVAAAMLKPVEAAGGWTKGPQIHGLNPLAAICGFTGPTPLFEDGDGYPRPKNGIGIPTQLGEMVLKKGMTFAMEPSCGFGKRAVTVGGAVIVGEEGAIELNSFTTRLQRIKV